MSPDMNIEDRLDDIEEKIDQNSKLLRSIKGKLTFNFWMGIIKVLVFVGVFYYVYRFSEPFLIQLKEAYISFQGLSDSSGDVKDNKVFDFLKRQ